MELSSPFELIPNEILVAVFQWLDKVRDLGAIAGVCKRFQRISYSKDVWVHVFQYEVPNGYLMMPIYHNFGYNTGLYLQCNGKLYCQIRVPKRILQRKSLPPRTQFIRVMHWFYKVHLNPDKLYARLQYGYAKSIKRERLLRQLEDTGCIPNTWKIKKETS